MQTAKPRAWSYSALAQFETCPKQHWHYRVKKDVKDTGNADSQYGEYVHKALAAYCMKGKPLPLDVAHMEKFAKQYKEAKTTERYAEVQIAIDANMEQTGWFDDDVYCRVIIDLLLVNDDFAMLVDWKTGKMKPDEEATQLSLSACVLMMVKPNINRVVMRYVWTKHGGKPTQFTLRREDIPRVWNSLAPRIQRYQNAYANDEFPANPSGLCRKWCPVTSCPHNGST